METYIYYYSSSKSEIDLLNSLIKDVNLENKDELFNVTNDILKLSFVDQIRVIHCILNTLYTIYNDSPTNKEKNIESFLAQKVFKPHREIILTIVDDDDENIWEEKISEIENKYNIKIKFEEA